MHFVRVIAEEILHKFAQRSFSPHFAVHIYYVRLVGEKCVVKLRYCPIDSVKRFAAFQHVMLSDEDNVAFRQVVIILTGQQRICVHKAAVISRTLRISALVTALNLDVVLLALVVNSVDIQPSRAALKIFQFKLRNHPNHCQIVPAKNYSEQQFRTLLVLKHLTHKGIVHQPEVPNDFKQFCSALRSNVCSNFVHRNQRPFLKL